MIYWKNIFEVLQARRKDRNFKFYFDQEGYVRHRDEDEYVFTLQSIVQFINSGTIDARKNRFRPEELYMTKTARFFYEVGFLGQYNGMNSNEGN